MGDPNTTSDKPDDYGKESMPPPRQSSVATPASFRSEGTGTVIGPYRVLQELGEGGFGVVYLAEQREPIQRRVALKIVKLGMDSKEVLARFEVERQALALMDHQNVAMFFDAGVTKSGRPYFAMEYVPGIPITDYCDQNKMTTRERLELFIPVCNAIQHAHQKGIIHRDLKPSNIMVMVQDGKPIPKVIDFGVAKAVAQRLTERTLFTEQGRLIGTPEYMSPEQAGTTGLDVDTRTDIYSLGVVLYHILVGSLPFDSRTLRSAGYEGILKIIREQDPPRMSTKLSSLGADQTAAAERRKSDPRALARILRGDLDWITMRALEKDRTRRYPTAEDLAHDIRRFLENEPVVARPPSASYKARKFVKRHRVGVLSSAAIGAALMLGLIGTGVGMVRANRLAGEREVARQEAIAQKTEAETAQARAETINGLLQGLLTSARPASGKGTDYTVREFLDEASRSMLSSSIGDSEIEASLRNTIGLAYDQLGLLEDAERHLTAALTLRRGDQTLSADTRTRLIAESLNSLGLTLTSSKKFEAAEKVLQEALAMRTGLLGPRDPATLATRHDLGLLYSKMSDSARAIPLLEDSLAVRRTLLPVTSSSLINHMNSLATAYAAAGRRDDAAKLHEEALSALRSSPELSQSVAMARQLNNTGQFYGAQGDLSRAEKALEEAVTLWPRHVRGDHWELLAAQANLALIYQGTGRLDDAARIFAACVEGTRNAGKARRGDLAQYLNNLANVLNDQGKLAEAEEIAREALSLHASEFGASSRITAFPTLLLGRILMAKGEQGEAEKVLQQAVDLFAGSAQPDAWETWQARSCLGECLLLQGKNDEAAPLITESYPKIKESRGPNHRRTQQALERCIKLAEAQGDPAKAEELKKLRPTPPK